MDALQPSIANQIWLIDVGLAGLTTLTIATGVTLVLRGSHWHSAGRAERFYLVWFVVLLSVGVVTLAVYVRLGVTLAVVVRAPNLGRTAPGCTVDDCYADLRNLLAVLTMTGPFLAGLGALAGAVCIAAPRRWRFVGVLLTLPLIWIFLSVANTLARSGLSA